MCEHQVWEMDVGAIEADGLCPLCLKEKLDILVKAVEEALTNGDEINTIDYRSTWRIKLRNVLDSLNLNPKEVTK